MPTPSPIPLAGAIAGDTFRNLVRQFSQELCFYRELIQNSLDASTNRVDVWLEYDSERGLAIAHVQDFGEGMDRAVIDMQLTRLFSSSKEDDFTKIGKFGIGFVSVFAVGPEAVVVDTGKNGESWRVIFKPSGEFERVKPETPMEGTHIQVFKRMKEAEFGKFRARSKDTVSYWCRHSAVDIFFDGVRVNEPFDVEGEVKVRVEEQGTDIVAALMGGTQTRFGFYNGGITLLEGELSKSGAAAAMTLMEPYGDRLAGISFKIKSRYLEHTLTRDNVKQDENFDKAIKILLRTVEGPLMKAMYLRLETAPELIALAAPFVGKTVRSIGWESRFVPCLGASAVLSPAALDHSRGAAAALLKRLGLTVADRVTLFDDRPTPVAAALEALHIPVVRCEADSALHRLLVDMGGLVQASARLMVIDKVPSTSVPPSLKALLNSTVRLLNTCGVHFNTTGFARLDAGQPYLFQHHADTLAVREVQHPVKHDEGPPLVDVPLGRGHLLIGISHPLVVRLGTVHDKDAATAAYMLAKVICLSDGLSQAMESRLLSASLG